jgi:HEAT repeat protein
MMNQEAERRPLETKAGNVPPPEGPAADKKLIESVKDLCAALVRAVSATKIFPSGHDSITQLRNGVFGRLRKFLDDHGELELDIKQGSFLYLDEMVYEEDNTLRSLPYFFHKDGMQKLAFMKGLTSEEFSDFLDVVRNVSFLPVDVGDIVDALWQRDFEHIRYLSPDEFIEAKLSGDQDLPREFDIKKEALYEGAIEFTAEDAEDIFRRSMELCRKNPEESGEAGLFAPLTEGDVQTLEDRLGAERREPVEKEFPEMMFEVLNLEDRPEDFARILASLEKHIYHLTLKLDFTQAVRFLNRIGEAAGLSATAASWKIDELEKFQTAVRARFPLDKLREKATEQRVPNSRTFFEYLKFVGPEALPLAADLFEGVRETEFRTDAQPYLEDMARKVPQSLVDLAGPDRPEFAKTVIAVLGQKPDASTIPYLLKFIATGRKDVKIEAVRAIGKFPDASAQESLSALLEDPDEELRIEVLKAITVTAGGEPARRLIGIASAKSFRRKTSWEKEAVLKALARSRTDEACDVLLKLIKRRSLFGRAKVLETRIRAIQAMATMATPAAAAALKGQARRRPNILRMEIRAALKQLVLVQGNEQRRPA